MRVPLLADAGRVQMFPTASLLQAPSVSRTLALSSGHEDPPGRDASIDDHWRDPSGSTNVLPCGAGEFGLLRHSSAARTPYVDCAKTPASETNATALKIRVDLYSGMPALLNVAPSTRSETDSRRGLETAIGAAIRCKFGKCLMPQW